MPKLVDIYRGKTIPRDSQGFYGKDYSNCTGPVTVFMSERTMQPDDVSPWHYHDGPVSVISEKGTVIGDEGRGHTKT